MRALVLLGAACLSLAAAGQPGVAQENTLSSLWDLLEPGEASVGVRDGTIVDTSSGQDPKAPATAMVMRAAGPCLAETSGAVQWPGEWGTLTTASYDFRKVTGYRFFPTAGEVDVSKPGLSPSDPKVQTIVIIGKDFACNQGVKLKPGAQTYQHSCEDMFVVGAFTPEDRQKALKALAKLQPLCGMPALPK